MIKALTTACSTLVALLLTTITASAHPGHPGHEYWPFEDLKMASIIGIPLIALAAVMLFRKFHRE